MRRIFLFIFLFSTFFAYAENSLQLSSAQAHPGDTVTLTLSMDNTDAVVAMQAMIPLHGQLTYVPGSCALTPRGGSHYVSATVLHDTLRIYSYSLSLTPYGGDSGDLLSFKVILKKEPGTYTLPLCSAMLSSATGSSLNVTTTAGSVTILAPKIALSTNSIDYGHVPIRSTYTQSVTVRNIGNEPLAMTGITFNDNTLSAINVAQTVAAGGQTTLTVQYAPVVPGAVNLSAVIHSNARVGDSVLSIAADPFSVNELRPLNAAGETDSIVTVSLRMNNMDSIVGLQTSFILPAALTYVPGSFAVSADRSQGHTATAGMTGDTLVLLVTSLQNKPLHDGDGVVATFQIRLHGYGYYALHPIKTALSNVTGQNVLSAVYSGGVQIYSPSLSCSNALHFGDTPVTDTARATLQVSNYGNATLVLQQVVLTNSDFVLDTPLPMTVPAWQSQTLTVRYTGQQEGTHTATMNLYSNDPNRPLVQVTLTANRYEPNYLTVSADANAPVEDAAVDIVLDNYSDITALQMDVVYPQSHYTMSVGDIHLTGRSNGHVVSAAAQNDSTLRVLILSMQNHPLIGHDGAVAHLNLHAVNPADEGHYPLRLRNVLTGGPDGLDRLTAWDSVVYIATRTVHDTTYIDVHDTTYIDVHDTTYIEVPYPVHDTTYIEVLVPVHDTTFITVHDTTYTILYDTAYIEVPYPIYDTLFVDIHDTTYITDYDTLYVEIPYPVHDTTYFWQYDTVIVTLHDTSYIDVPYPVHDTTYITLTDTLYVTLHDTTYITVHDTVTEPVAWHTLQLASDDLSKGFAVGSGQFAEGSVVEIAAIPVEGYRFMQWSDGSTANPRTVTINGDLQLTAQFGTTSVNDHDLSPLITLFPNPADSYVDVRTDGDLTITMMEVYDIHGKLLRTVKTQNFASLQTTRINVSDLADGMYFLRATTEAGAVTKTFVVKR